MKAIILLSGGLDSTVALAIAHAKGRQCFGLSFDYSQRHLVELKAASRIASHYNIPHKVVTIDPSVFGQSALIDKDHPIPTGRTVEEIEKGGIPSSYVPARNTLFLSYAMGFAEMMGAEEIYFGAAASDRFGYPDCRPAFIDAFQGVIDAATNGQAKLVTPLKDWDKSEIIRQGEALCAPLHLSISCYNPSSDGIACRICDACILREKGFLQSRV